MAVHQGPRPPRPDDRARPEVESRSPIPLLSLHSLLLLLPLSLVRTQAAPTGETFAHGAGATGQASDYTITEQNLAPISDIRDITSTTAVLANATATAHLRQRKLDERDGVLVVQPHVGLEVLDIIAIDQPLISASTITARIMALRWQYTKHRARLDQTLTLGPK